MNETSKTGQALNVDDGKTKWQGQEIGVNSNIPLVDSGTGKPYIIRRFRFAFNPLVVQQIRQKKIPAPTHQELFNSNWNQIRTTLWGDGLIAIQEKELPPKIIIKRKWYEIVVVCEPKRGVIVADHISTLQEITKPKSTA